MGKNLKWRAVLVISVVLFFLVYLAPTFLGKKKSEKEKEEEAKRLAEAEKAGALGVVQKEKEGILPSWWPGDKLSLGLDLQGGMHIVYNIKADVYIKNERDRIKDYIKEKFDEEKIEILSFEDVGISGVDIKIKNSQDLEKARKIINDTYPQDSYEVFDKSGSIISIVMRDRLLSYYERNAVEQVRKNLLKRVDELGVKEPTIVVRGNDRIIVELPGVMDPLRAEKILKNPGVLHFKIVKDRADSKEELLKKYNNKLPEGTKIYAQRVNPEHPEEHEYFLLKEVADFEGTNLSYADMGYDEEGGYAINFGLDAAGAKLFEQLTSKNIGKRLAIVLNDQVESAPTIRSTISSRGQITGNFTLEEAKDLAVVLRSGALPVPIETEEQRTVGASLGQDSIQKGTIAAIVGSITTVLFMIIYYKLGGLIAVFALILNALLLLGVMSAIGATLTLPGIAGIVLTIGMAVDANVLIFERMREEFRLGKTMISALDAGYSKAIRAILDSNITTLIAGIVLYQYGTGPIKGFAVTLSLGIITSVFTAVVVTRLMLDYLAIKRKVSKLNMLSWFKTDSDIDFPKLQKYGLYLSAILVVGTFILFGVKDINYGIDFSGGAEILVKFNKEVSASQVRSSISSLDIGESLVQTFGDPSHYEYVIKVGGDPEKARDISQQMSQKFEESFGKDNFEIKRVDMVGPKVGSELRKSGLLSIIMASILIAIYIAFRFDVNYAPGALISTIHDAILPLGIILLFNKEFTLQIIAAILTLVGYSINDKIVVFDRIRELRQKYKTKQDLKWLIRRSLNEILSRTLLTGITTLTALLSLAFLGGEVIHDFAIIIFWGIIIGTYSSIFVASPFIVFMEKWRGRYVPVVSKK